MTLQLPWSKIEQLEEHHEVQEFDCGESDLNDWLARSALSAQTQGSVAVHVVLDEENKVVGYFALSINEVYGFNLPARARTGGHKVQGILLGKLALSAEYRGQGYGSHLLLEALRVCVSVSSLIGGRVILVDMRNIGLTKFYEAHNFLPVNSGQPLRRYMRMATARALLAAYDPAI